MPVDHGLLLSMHPYLGSEFSCAASAYHSQGWRCFRQAAHPTQRAGMEQVPMPCDDASPSPFYIIVSWLPPSTNGMGHFLVTETAAGLECFVIECCSTTYA